MASPSEVASAENQLAKVVLKDPSLEGKDSSFIKLISADNHEFYIKRELALLSETIKSLLESPGEFKENSTNEFHLTTVPSYFLQTICKYFSYKAHYANVSSDIPEFPLEPETVMELLMAANYLDC